MRDNLLMQIATIPAQSRPIPLFGGDRVLRSARDLAWTAAATMRVDTFRPTDRPTLDVFHHAARRGVEVSFRVDTRAAAQVTKRLREYAQVVEYGDAPLKQHGKAIAVDGVFGLVGTDVSDSESRGRMDMGVQFGGAAAAALDRLLAIDSSRLVTAAERNVVEDARATGILLNDPRLGVRHATDAIRDALTGAERTLLVSTKQFDDATCVAQLQDAVRRGVAARLVTNDIPDVQRAALEQAGVAVTLIAGAVDQPPAVSLHGTLIVVDESIALVGSPYLVTRVLDGSDTRQSREMMVAVSGATAREFAQAAIAAYG